MDISTHRLRNAHPVETGWVDDSLAGVYASGEPIGALVGRPLDGGDGIMLVGWPDGGPGRFHLIDTIHGKSTGLARYVQVVTFDGPRTDQWAAAEQRASTERIAPATRNIPGIVQVLRARAADNAILVAVLAESLDAIHSAVEAIATSTLLPGEDPALLTGPDRVAVYRLLHADLRVDETTSQGA